MHEQQIAAGRPGCVPCQRSFVCIRRSGNETRRNTMPKLIAEDLPPWGDAARGAPAHLPGPIGRDLDAASGWRALRLSLDANVRPSLLTVRLPNLILYPANHRLDIVPRKSRIRCVVWKNQIHV